LFYLLPLFLISNCLSVCIEIIVIISVKTKDVVNEYNKAFFVSNFSLFILSNEFKLATFSI
jgi:hypothetical protein